MIGIAVAYGIMYLVCVWIVDGANEFIERTRTYPPDRRKVKRQGITPKSLLQGMFLFAFILLRSGLAYIRDNSGEETVRISESLSIAMEDFTRASFWAAVLLCVALVISLSASRAKFSTWIDTVRKEADVPEGAVSVDKMAQGLFHFAVLVLYGWTLSGYLALVV